MSIVQEPAPETSAPNGEVTATTDAQAAEGEGEGEGEGEEAGDGNYNSKDSMIPMQEKLTYRKPFSP